MKSSYSKLTSQGQISVPAEVRRKLGLRPGSKIRWKSAAINSSLTGRPGIPRRTFTAPSSESRRKRTRSRRSSEASSITCTAIKRAVDTKILVRLITRDDEAQTLAAERVVAQGAWVSVLVLADATRVLATVYSLKRKQIALAIEMLLAHEQLVLQDADIVSAALSDFRRGTIQCRVTFRCHALRLLLRE